MRVRVCVMKIEKKKKNDLNLLTYDSHSIGTRFFVFHFYFLFCFVNGEFKINFKISTLEILAFILFNVIKIQQTDTAGAVYQT